MRRLRLPQRHWPLPHPASVKSPLYPAYASAAERDDLATGLFNHFDATLAHRGVSGDGRPDQNHIGIERRNRLLRLSRHRRYATMALSSFLIDKGNTASHG